MKSMYKFYFTAVLTFLFTLSLNTSLSADDSLKPDLIDIPGWQGEPAQAMTMEMNGINMITATRSYEKADNSFDAAILITTQQMGMMSFQQMSMSEGGISINSTQMDGFKVVHSHDANENSGNFMVLLGETTSNSALFSMSYEGLSDKESLAIAKIYDWKAMQAAAEKLMK